MATKAQRVKAILDALADTTVDDTRADRVVAAFVAEYGRGLTLTASQQRGLVLQHIRNFVKERVRAAEVAAVATARQTAEAGADIELGADGSE